MIKSIYDVPFCTIKKILYIRDSSFTYGIDEDGYGLAIIDGERIRFFVDEYGEIDTNSIRYETEIKQNTSTKN